MNFQATYTRHRDAVERAVSEFADPSADILAMEQAIAASALEVCAGIDEQDLMKMVELDPTILTWTSFPGSYSTPLDYLRGAIARDLCEQIIPDFWTTEFDRLEAFETVRRTKELLDIVIDHMPLKISHADDNDMHWYRGLLIGRADQRTILGMTALIKETEWLRDLKDLPNTLDHATLEQIAPTLTRFDRVTGLAQRHPHLFITHCCNAFA